MPKNKTLSTEILHTIRKIKPFLKVALGQTKKQKRTNLTILALALVVLLIGLDADPASAKANMSASLVGSLPPNMVQEFRQGVGVNVIHAQEAPVKKEIPKQAPKYSVAYTMSVSSTGYSSTPWETSGNPFVTASGAWVYWGVVASNELPFGTKLRIPEYYGDKIFTVEDTGGFGYGAIDIWFDQTQKAINWGRRRITVEVLS